MRDLLLLTHFTGLIIGAGSGFAILVIGYLSSRFPNEVREKVLISMYPLRYISYMGLLLLVVSGVQLLISYWATVLAEPLFIVKLSSVAAIILISIFGFYQMATTRSDNSSVRLKLLGIAGKIGFILSLVVVTCATYTFH